MKKILNIAHRGASGHAPENTLKAFKQAITLGADFVELDVQLTRDNRLVVFHDTEFDDDQCIAQMSYAQVKKKAADQKGIDICTLNQALIVTKKKIGVNIEIKSPDAVNPVLELVAQQGFDNIILSSLLPNCLWQLKNRTIPVMIAPVIDSSLEEPIDLLNVFETDLVIQNFKHTDKEYVDLLHRSEKRIFVWTVNTKKDLKQAVECGVDGIITNYPDRLSALLSS